MITKTLRHTKKSCVKRLSIIQLRHQYLCKKMELEQSPKENFFKEILKFTLIAIIIVIPIRAFIAQPFIVSGSSMDPTFSSGQYLIVDQVTYRFEDPKRFDVIIFKYPLNPDNYFIKRIIGLPNEKISLRSGKIIITNKEYPDGNTVDDPYVTEASRTYDNFDITLSEKEYFVMGDNRGQSSDSRIWGALEKKYIVGRPIVRLTPISKISILPGK